MEQKTIVIRHDNAASNISNPLKELARNIAGFLNIPSPAKNICRLTKVTTLVRRQDSFEVRLDLH